MDLNILMSAAGGWAGATHQTCGESLPSIFLLPQLHNAQHLQYKETARSCQGRFSFSGRVPTVGDHVVHPVALCRRTRRTKLLCRTRTPHSQHFLLCGACLQVVDSLRCIATLSGRLFAHNQTPDSPHMHTACESVFYSSHKDGVFRRVPP